MKNSFWSNEPKQFDLQSTIDAIHTFDEACCLVSLNHSWKEESYEKIAQSLNIVKEKLSNAPSDVKALPEIVEFFEKCDSLPPDTTRLTLLEYARSVSRVLNDMQNSLKSFTH